MGTGASHPTERTDEQTSIGIFWAYDGTPSLCAPPRLYNQILLTIADQMQTDFLDLTRLLAIANVAMADAGIAIWESKYFYQVWRPVTGIREADRGSGPTGQGDGNRATIGDPTFSPLGAPASNLTGPDFTPPFPAYPSGHAGFGGALFEVLRQFYGRDDIAFTFTSDEFNGGDARRGWPGATGAAPEFFVIVGGRRRERAEPNLSGDPLVLRQDRRDRTGAPGCAIRRTQCLPAPVSLTGSGAAGSSWANQVHSWVTRVTPEGPGGSELLPGPARLPSSARNLSKASRSRLSVFLAWTRAPCG